MKINRKPGLLWVIRMEHRVMNINENRKASQHQERSEGNRDFEEHHSFLYKTIWRGWCKPTKAMGLDW